jgi:hypothetical protein
MTWQTRLKVEEAGHDKSGRSVWELIEPLVFESERFGRIEVPTLFRTNYASVPRLPMVFLLAGDKAHKEATLHDAIYTFHWLTREEADDLFLEALLLNPLIGENLAWMMHKGVRWFGQSSWDDTSNIFQRPEITALIRP